MEDDEESVLQMVKTRSTVVHVGPDEQPYSGIDEGIVIDDYNECRRDLPCSTRKILQKDVFDLSKHTNRVVKPKSNKSRKYGKTSSFANNKSGSTDAKAATVLVKVGIEKLHQMTEGLLLDPLHQTIPEDIRARYTTRPFLMNWQRIFT